MIVARNVLKRIIKKEWKIPKESEGDRFLAKPLSLIAYFQRD